MTSPRSRFPRSVFEKGAEPDPRFTLANERTFLAWIRTALALAAAGIALEALSLPIPQGLRFAAALLFVVLSLLAAVHAWFGWARTETSMRESRALPGAALSAVLAAGVTVAVLLVGIGLLL